MLTATALTVAISVTVSAAPDISSTLVRGVQSESDAIWHDTGFSFRWSPESAAVDPPLRSTTTLRVVINHDVRPGNAGGLALGWIVFEDGRTSEPEIHLSYNNAERLLRESPGVVGIVSNMPQLERDMLLARALGRALAHEMGHYLLASKAHTPKGLMQARWTAVEFFLASPPRFEIDLAQRAVVMARLRRDPVA